MVKNLKKEFQQRWIVELDYEINQSLKKENWKDKTEVNVRWLKTPFGITVDEKIDFRGFPFREPIKYQHIVGIDFSFSQTLNELTDGYGMSRGLTGFSNSIFENCDFICANLPANLSEEFIDCNFTEASFDSTRINAVFKNCIFIKSNIKNIIGSMKFIHCNFSESKILRSNLQNCYFESCIFDNAKFNGSNISGSKFINTTLTEQQLESCSLKDGIVIK